MIRKGILLAGATSLVLVLILVLLQTRPDRGGATQCENLTKIEGLSIYLGNPKLIFPWKPFEEPKFRFSLNRSLDIESYLISRGYTNWKRGGIEFGSISVGDESYEDHVDASLKLPNGTKVYVSISKLDNEVIFILRN
jgi:hypothetical protein